MSEHRIEKESTLEAQMTEMACASDAYTIDFNKAYQNVQQSKAIYKGKPVPYLYIPKMYFESDLETFKAALDGMHDLTHRTIELYLERPDVRALFGFDSRLEALIMQPHDYSVTVPMGRFDIFYYGHGDYMFCELNTDGASAMNEEKELTSVLAHTAIVDAFRDQYRFEKQELFHSWVKEVGAIYEEFSKTRGLAHKAEPDTFVAIVDFVDKSSPIEFEVFLSAFETAGYRCAIVDPRDVTCENGALYYEGARIDVVYRRLVTKDLMDRYDEIPAFVQGILANQTCMIGSIKTQVVHTKRFFEVLHTPSFRVHLTEAQRAFIDAHVPYTQPLDHSDERFNQYINNRANYIIKPVDYYASKGVCAGKDYADADWSSLLEEKSQEDFIIQTYCPVAPVRNVLKNHDGQLEPADFNTITGLFTYNGKLSGVYVRAGLNAIISGLHDGFTMSTLLVEPLE